MSGFTAADLLLLKEAYQSGVTDVWMGSRRVTYRSVADMERAIANITRSLSATPSASSRIQWKSKSGL